MLHEYSLIVISCCIIGLSAKISSKKRELMGSTYLEDYKAHGSSRLSNSDYSLRLLNVEWLIEFISNYAFVFVLTVCVILVPHFCFHVLLIFWHSKCVTTKNHLRIHASLNLVWLGKKMNNLFYWYWCSERIYLPEFIIGNNPRTAGGDAHCRSWCGIWPW